MSIYLTEQEFAGLFAEYPSVRKAESGAPLCPYCGNALSPEALEFYNGSTEAGTDCCSIEITCDVCGKEIWRGGSWYPGIETREELIEVAADVLSSEVKP